MISVFRAVVKFHSQNRLENMTAIAFSQFRKRMNELLQEMKETGEPLTVTRADGNDFVIMSAQEWESIQETLHITSSPENVRRLRAAHSEIEAEIARRKKAAA